MTRSLVRLLFVTPLAFAFACSGGGGGEDDTGGGSGGRAGSSGKGGSGGGAVGNPGTLSDHALERNPKQTLECGDPKSIQTGPTPFVRLTNAQYFTTMDDLLAPAKLETKPDLPLETIKDGFWTNADLQSASDDLVTAFEIGARAAGAAVAKNLGQLKIDGCPPSGASAEEACADKFIASFGKRAWRHPLDDGEKMRLKDFYKSMRGTYDFSTSIDLLTEAMLQSPQFLYRVEVGDGKVAGTDKLKLSNHELAARLSYLLWDTMPDATLTSAADAGELTDARKLEDHVARMLKDDRAKRSVWEFSRQWLDLQRLAGLAESKDTTKFASWSSTVSSSLSDGLKSFVQDSLLSDGGSLGKLLTSNKAFVTDKTAFVYGVNAPSGGTLASVDVDASKRQGLLTQGYVMAGLAKQANHSPVLRGVFVLERVMCAPPLPPPNNMVPKAVNSLPADAKVTTRQRLQMEHEGQGSSCQGCHVYIDGVGFAFENYDAVGQYRTQEEIAGTKLDVDPSTTIVQTRDVDGKYPNAIELSKKLAGSEQVAQCFAEHWYRYALARSLTTKDDDDTVITQEDGCNIASITDAFVAAKGDFKTLMSSIVQSPAFRYRSPLSN